MSPPLAGPTAHNSSETFSQWAAARSTPTPSCVPLPPLPPLSSPLPHTNGPPSALAYNLGPPRFLAYGPPKFGTCEFAPHSWPPAFLLSMARAKYPGEGSPCPHLLNSAPPKCLTDFTSVHILAPSLPPLRQPDVWAVRVGCSGNLFGQSKEKFAVFDLKV